MSREFTFFGIHKSKKSSFRFDGVEMFSAKYILFQTLNVANMIHATFSYLHCFYSLNLFYMTCMRFFSKRFSHIGRQVKIMSLSKSIDSRKLFEVLSESNKVHHDLILINNFFKNYVGFNLISFFLFGVMGAFIVLLDIDWRRVKQFKVFDSITQRLSR